MHLEPKFQQILFGHGESFDILKKLKSHEKLPNKIIFSGEKGIGKCTLAYHFINYVLSLNEDFSYDTKNYKINNQNKSFKLILNKSNPNFNLIDVKDGKKTIDINQVRDLISNLNKSSFNLKPRFILIDNIELLNLSSTNALLKIIEEPNDNIYFLLINNNKRVLPTLKSRCINFKVSLSKDKVIEISNRIVNQDIIKFLNHELINYYSTPGQIIKIINFLEEYKIDIKNLSFEQLLSLLINSKIYKKDKTISEFIFLFIEIYFRNNVSIHNIELINKYRYFLKKINNTKIYNLDEETLFMEFDDIILNG